jgi:hypothetical protein
METTAGLLTLTDDEVAALAMSLQDLLRAPLPTVDRTSRDNLARAVYRGRRSLVVRDLADSEGTPIGATAEVAKRLGAGLRAFFLFADDAGNWVPNGVTIYLYGPVLDAIEVSQTVADAGVHYFRLAPPPGQWQALTMLAQSIHADGFTDPAGHHDGARPAAALLHVVRPDGIRFIRVARGTATTGRGPVPARFPSIADAISWLLG